QEQMMEVVARVDLNRPAQVALARGLGRLEVHTADDAFQPGQQALDHRMVALCLDGQVQETYQVEIDVVRSRRLCRGRCFQAIPLTQAEAAEQLEDARCPRRADLLGPLQCVQPGVERCLGRGRPG